MTKKLTLISHLLCPYVQRAAIALAEKGVPFEKIYIDLNAKPDWFLKISPLGKVPLLKVEQDDGSEAVLFESSVIAEYIEETEGEPRLHPDNALERARHRVGLDLPLHLDVERLILNLERVGHRERAVNQRGG